MDTRLIQPRPLQSIVSKAVLPRKAVGPRFSADDSGSPPDKQPLKKAVKKPWLKRVRRSIAAFALMVTLTPGLRRAKSVALPEPELPLAKQVQENPARVFVIQSGLGDTTSWVGHGIESTLSGLPDSQGHPVSKDNIIVLDNIYTDDITEIKRINSFSKAAKLMWTGWKQGLRDLFSGHLPAKPVLFKLFQSLFIYWRSAEPDSAVVRQQYERLAEVLQKRGLQKAEVILIGHSAGGQLALSMAARNAQSPQAPFHISTVVTLGSPILKNTAPKPVRILSFVGKDDELEKTLDHSQRWLGLTVTTKHPPNLDENDATFEVDGLSHSNLQGRTDIFKQLLEHLDPPGKEKPQDKS